MQISFKVVIVKHQNDIKKGSICYAVSPIREKNRKKIAIFHLCAIGTFQRGGRGKFCFGSKCSNVSITPVRQWGFRQCLPFSWTTVRDKHCPHSIAVMWVVDTFGQYDLIPLHRQIIHWNDEIHEKLIWIFTTSISYSKLNVYNKNYKATLGFLACFWNLLKLALVFTCKFWGHFIQLWSYWDSQPPNRISIIDTKSSQSIVFINMVNTARCL